MRFPSPPAIASRPAIVEDRVRREGIKCARAALLAIFRQGRGRYAVTGTTEADLLQFIPNPCREQRRIIEAHGVIQAAYWEPGSRRIVRFIAPLVGHEKAPADTITMGWHMRADETFRQLEAQWAQGAGLVYREIFTAYPKRETLAHQHPRWR